MYDKKELFDLYKSETPYKWLEMKIGLENIRPSYYRGIDSWILKVPYPIINLLIVFILHVMDNDFSLIYAEKLIDQLYRKRITNIEDAITYLDEIRKRFQKI